jgi:mono/diheme cytochrome c family protein
MTSLRNPLLMVVCLLLLANLLFNKPDPGRDGNVPHARRDGFKSHTQLSSSGSLTAAGGGVRDENDAAAFGQLLYSSNCTACHGSRGHGMPRQGANLRESRFIAEQSDEALVAFLKQGRTPADPRSLMGMLMPPRGGNRTLDNAALGDIVAFLRELQDEAKHESAAAKAATPTTVGAAGETASNAQ